MKKILVIGAGRSSTSLIKYLLDNSTQENWLVTVVDFNIELAQKKINNHLQGSYFKLDAMMILKEENLFLNPMLLYLCYLQICTIKY